MPGGINILFIYSAVVIFVTACDKKNVALIVKDQTTRQIIGAALVDDSLADDDLFKDHVDMNINLNPGEFQGIGIFGFEFGNKHDTSKIYLYIFNTDTLNNCRNFNIRKGILAKSVIKKLIIPLNTINKLDTLYVK